MTRRLVLVVVLFALAFAELGCKRKGSEPEAAPAPPLVTDTSNELLLTWIDDKGEFHVEQRPDQVPAAAREVVRVVDPSRDAPADDVWVADLRSKDPQGSYAVRAMKRTDFENLAVARRDGGVLTARPPSSAEVVAQPTVIIYGASWCGPCHQAAAHLKQRGVAFVEKDIEEDGSAAREMHAKLAKAGMRGGSIPVLDVRGKILVGFDAGALDRALGAR